MLRREGRCDKDDEGRPAVTLEAGLAGAGAGAGGGAAHTGACVRIGGVTREPPDLPDLPDLLEAAPTFREALRRDLPRGVRSGLVTFWSLARAMVPAYGLALVLEKLGVIAAIARVAQPVMSLVGLPGSAAVPLVMGYVLNIYAAVGAMTALHLSAAQITVLALAILIGHNLLVEGAVLRRAGMSGVGFGVLRALSGLLAAGVANLLMKAFS